MAKGNLFLGTGRSKLGDIVLYRRFGKQVSRVRVTPQNPKTEGQSVQRMIFASVASSSSALKSIVDHSFEGVQPGQACLNRFAHINLPIARGMLSSYANYSYLLKGAKGVACLPLQVSEGSLAPLSVAHDYTEQGKATLVVQGGANLSWWNSQAITDEGIYRTVLSQLGLEPGMQLTWVWVIAQCDVNGVPVAAWSYNGMYNVRTYVVLSRVIFKPASEVDYSGEKTIITDDGYIDETFIDTGLSENYRYIRGVISSGQISFVANLGYNLAMGCGGTVIKSMRIGNDWAYSAQTLKWAMDFEQYMNVHRDGWYSYSQVVTDSTSEYYLDQATMQRGAVAASGANISFVSLVSNDVTLSDVTSHGRDVSATTSVWAEGAVPEITVEMGGIPLGWDVSFEPTNMQHTLTRSGSRLVVGLTDPGFRESLVEDNVAEFALVFTAPGVDMDDPAEGTYYRWEFSLNKAV